MKWSPHIQLSHAQIPLGKRIFKRHIELFFDPLFLLYCEPLQIFLVTVSCMTSFCTIQSSASPQLRAAGVDCLGQLTQQLGRNIVRGRVEQHNPPTWALQFWYNYVFKWTVLLIVSHQSVIINCFMLSLLVAACHLYTSQYSWANDQCCSSFCSYGTTVWSVLQCCPFLSTEYFRGLIHVFISNKLLLLLSVYSV